MLPAQLLALALTAAPLVSALTLVSDKNDWDTACTDGSCRYYTGDGLTKAFSTISLTGPATALGDISPAAGWLIQGCDAKWSDGAMKVTLVCSGTPAQMANCASLFAGGAKDTIVRLPESCGTGPFARVVSSNNVTPSSRVGAPETHELVLDYDFAAITEDRGEVEFEVTTSNLEETGILPRGDVMKRWSANKMFNLPLINIDQSKNLFNSSVNCPAAGGTGVGFSASISVDAHAKVNAQVAFGFTISGSIIPPKVKNAQVLGSINGSAVGDFVVAAQASGSFETGQVQIYSVGLPGLSIPGILTVGPSFGLKGRLYAEVGVAANVRAGVNWNFPGVEVAFPNNNEAGANAIQSSSPLIISLDPSASAHGLVTASIIPRLDVGVSILMGLAEATLFVDLEARAELDLSLTAEGHYTTSVPKRALNPALNPNLIATPVSLISTPVLTSPPLALTGIATDLPIISRPTDLTFIGNPVLTSGPIPTGVITKLPTLIAPVETTTAGAAQSWSASGCASLDLVLDINAGATGKLKPIFDKAVTWDLYTKEVNVFNKCFNVGSTAVPRKRAREFREVTTLQRRAFQCPALGLGNLLELFRN